MQPNGQSGQPYVSPTGSNVPEYLHMDPITEPPKKRKLRKGPIFIVATVILAVILGAVFFVFTYKTPESRLYEAIESLMSTKYIPRDIAVHRSELDGVISIAADSDFSTPSKPRTQLEYKYDGFSKDNLLTGEIITLDGEHYAGRVTSTPVVIPGNIKTNVWYKAKSSTPFRDNPDVFGVYEDTNNSVGSLLLGSYPADNIKKIVELLQSEEIYKIESSASKTQDGMKGTQYVLAVNHEKLNKLVGDINIDLGMKLKPPVITSTNTIEVFVSNESGSVVRIIEKVKQEDLDVKVETKLSYPDTITLSPPSELSGDD